MKKRCPNPYATNRGGKIEAPKNPAADDPKATRIESGKNGDLRQKKG